MSKKRKFIAMAMLATSLLGSSMATMSYARPVHCIGDNHHDCTSSQYGNKIYYYCCCGKSMGYRVIYN